MVVASHGVGASGANVCFAELFRGGVETIIRAGTCGAIVTGIRDGDLVIATAAVREDGASDQLISPTYPAVADRRVVRALADAAARRDLACREGLIVTEATFYPGAYPPRWRSYTDYGALAVEMEMSALFVMAGMHGARAGGIVTVDGNLIETRSPDMSDYDPDRDVVKRGVAAMLGIAVDAATELASSE
jgi:uridine phosphorylase